MDAALRFPGGATGHITASLLSRTLLRIGVRVTGDKGEMRVLNFVLPHVYHRLTVRTAQGRRTEQVKGEATYTSQLRAFTQAILQGTPVPTHPADAIANMRVIDAVYLQAGLNVRGDERLPVT
jgi:predicted dehydrogenase